MFYAKSDPKETLREHTDKLLERFKRLYELNNKKYLYMSERDWKLLRIAALYHDIGKAEAVFQNKIRKVLKEIPLIMNSNLVVRHNHLSVLAIPYKELGITKEERRIVVQAVGFHHENDVPIIKDDLLEIYQKNILPILKDIEEHMGCVISNEGEGPAVDRLNSKKRIKLSDGELFYRYVMIKGLLHRLDHSASAHVEVELATECHPSDYVNRYFKKIRRKPRPLQEFTEANQDKHLLIIAQTGMGKTEAGFLWLGEDKGFFTLPLRTSINAMYKRILDSEKGIGFSKVSESGEEQALGLLHSTSLDFLDEMDQEKGDAAKLNIVYEQSRQFANKVIISTIDQIMKFPFFYKGFEKELATLAGAKIIIDEMQAYDPKIAALLIRGLELIDRIGGKFMIMTATMPDIYVKALEKQLGNSVTPLVKEKFIDDQVIRHHLKLHSMSILDGVDRIIEAGKAKKVLVICNTVQQAKDVYESIQGSEINVSLLHSQFIRRDRAEKEQLLKDFEQSDECGIWVTTQLVEASLDIDFDVLYTEMSTLDSLFQRFGRCNRYGEKTVISSNVHVFTEEVSGVGVNAVYHPEIYCRSLFLLEKCNDSIILESQKMNLIDQLYDAKELEGTAYYTEFKEALRELNNFSPYEIGKTDAQYILRNIQQTQVIPRNIFYQEGIAIIEQYEQASDKYEKRRLKRKFEQFTVGVNRWKASEHISQSELPKQFRDIYVIDFDYSSEMGVDFQNFHHKFL